MKAPTHVTDAETYGFAATELDPLSRDEIPSPDENGTELEEARRSLAIPATFAFQLGRRSNFIPKTGFLSM